MELLSRINWVDILVVILITRISYVALNDGLSHEIFPLIGTVATAAISAHYYHQLAAFIQDMVKLPAGLGDLLAFMTLVIVVGIVFKILRLLVDAVMKVTWNPLLEKSGGLVFGLLRSSVVVSLLLMILALTPLSYLRSSIEEKSLSGRYFLKIAPRISDSIKWIFPEVLKK